MALLALEERLAWTARVPGIIAVSGVAASGKTTLAEALAARSGLPHLSADDIRKRLLGLDPAARAPASAYTEEARARVYRELGCLAGRAGSAIVDATFHRRWQRDIFRAQAGGAEHVVFVECRAPLAVLEQRVVARAQDPGRVSDATLEVLRRQLGEAETLDEVPPARHLSVRADQPVDALVATVADALDRR
jgi:predicted kinase